MAEGITCQELPGQKEIVFTVPNDDRGGIYGSIGSVVKDRLNGDKKLQLKGVEVCIKGDDVKVEIDLSDERQIKQEFNKVRERIKKMVGEQKEKAENERKEKNAEKKRYITSQREIAEDAIKIYEQEIKMI